MSRRLLLPVLALAGVFMLVALSATPSQAALSATPDWIVTETRAGAGFGRWVSAAGDVNGDGFDDVLVGAPGWDDFSHILEGKVCLYLGSASGLSTAPAWVFEGNQDFAYLGLATSAGDVNGDGFGDVIVGAGEYDSPILDGGRAWIFLGSDSGLPAAPAWTASAGWNQGEAYFGFAVAGLGDVNGDGFDDVMVGAPGYEFNLFDEGGAFLFLGSASGPSTSPDQEFEGNQVLSAFGNVAAAGDFNGDGRGDALIGANGHDTRLEDQGRAYLLRGSAPGLLPRRGKVLEIDGESHFGVVLGTAGDINADGYDDFFITAGHPLFAERLFIYLGSGSHRPPAPDQVLQPDQASPASGISVRAAGDVNGDGFDDLIVGVPRLNDGRVLLYRGTASGLDPVPLQTLDGVQPSEGFGYSVSTAGDVNGDGFDDVIIGAPSYDNLGSGAGRALVFHGGP